MNERTEGVEELQAFLFELVVAWNLSSVQGVSCLEMLPMANVNNLEQVPRISNVCNKKKNQLLSLCP
jgi:hypothetical protein